MAITTGENEAAQSALSGMGFTYEGNMRGAYPSGADALIYGMLRQECRWIDGFSREGGR